MTNKAVSAIINNVNKRSKQSSQGIEKTLKKIKKSLDKKPSICYNKDVNKNKQKKMEELIMTKKMTKKEWFAEIRAIVEVAELKEEKKTDMMKFIDREVELLEKKHSKSGQTKTQKENVEIMEKIVSALVAIGKPVTITELQNGNKEMTEYSNQKLSALLKKLVESDRVVKTQEKKKSYFSAK